MDRYSTIQKIDDNTLQLNDYETGSRRYGFKIKYSTIAGIIVIVAVLIGAGLIISGVSGRHGTDKNDNTEDTSSQSDAYSPFSYDGYILPGSSTQYITEQDISDMKDEAMVSDYSYGELLRFSINEIYARHGYRFITGGKYDTFYSQFAWYNTLEKVDEVPWGQMNQYEQNNLRLLLQEEKEL